MSTRSFQSFRPLFPPKCSRHRLSASPRRTPPRRATGQPSAQGPLAWQLTPLGRAAPTSATARRWPSKLIASSNSRRLWPRQRASRPCHSRYRPTARHRNNASSPTALPSPTRRRSRVGTDLQPLVQAVLHVRSAALVRQPLGRVEPLGVPAAQQPHRFRFASAATRAPHTAACAAPAKPTSSGLTGQLTSGRLSSRPWLRSCLGARCSGALG